MRKLLCLIIAAGIVNGATALHAKSRDESTGICFRRIAALDRKGRVVSRYESVLVRQSSSLADDIQRIKAVFSGGSPLLTPDLPANRWVAASISNSGVDGTANEHCSMLPTIRERHRRG